MIRVNQIKVRPDYKKEDLIKKIASILKVLPEDILDIKIDRKSVDARKKPDIFIVLSVICQVKREESILRHNKNNDVSLYEPVEYSFKPSGKKKLNNPIVVVGAGPAGLFASYMLAKEGYKPILLERGYDINARTEDVEKFWSGAPLNPDSNVLFGAGGAGAFSDGKLNTLVKDKTGRNEEVLKTFVSFGANPEIMYEAKPHVGTDVLKTVVDAMCKEIINLGGKIIYNAFVTDIICEDKTLSAVIINNIVTQPCDACVLAIGHSARDTFKMLYDKGIFLEQKDFAVGVRIEHKQKMINDELLSTDPEVMKHLKPAAYKLTYKAENGRGVYSFCMCPGGYVVNASSEPGRLCINGMSYSSRAGENANSAIVVTVNHNDFGNDHPLAGIEFQRRLEEKAFEIGNGAIPVQTYKDFKTAVLDTVNLDDFEPAHIMDISPQTKGTYSRCSVSDVFPKEISKTLVEGIDYFDKIIPGFAGERALVSAVESRTSSPVRITRDEAFESVNVKGLYPCGEGAGYAGGIMSAAMDGIKVYEKLASKFSPLRDCEDKNEY